MLGRWIDYIIRQSQTMPTIYCSTLFIRQKVRYNVLVWVFPTGERESVGSKKHFCYIIKVTTELIWKILQPTQIADFNATGRNAPFIMITGVNGFIPGSEGRRRYFLAVFTETLRESKWVFVADRLWWQTCIPRAVVPPGGQMEAVLLVAVMGRGRGTPPAYGPRG